LILNPTNKNILIDALGKQPRIGLVQPLEFRRSNVTLGGKRTGGVRLKCCCLRQGRQASSSKPTTPAAAATEWSEEKGDPGADPSMADFEPAE
jgi:hypothetical protein